MIKNLVPRLAEIGRIKIGGVGEERTANSGNKYRSPVKYDHFVITTMQRGANGNFERDQAVHQVVGEKPLELEIVLLYNEEPGKESLNFRTQYAFYQGKKCLCRGDGETGREVVDFGTGEYKEVACPCSRLELEKNPCKPHGTLNCLLRAAEMAGGVWRFSTTSWNTVQNIIGSLKFLTACTGGKLAGIPLIMKYFKKSTYTPKGDPTTIGVVGLLFKGSPVQMLEAAVAQEKKRLEAGIRMETLALEVRKDFERQQADFAAGPLDPDELEEFGHSEDDHQEQRESLGDALAKKAKAPGVEMPPKPPVAPNEETVVPVPVSVKETKESPIEKTTEKPKESEPKNALLRYFACAICATAVVDYELPRKCQKCPSEAFKEFPTLTEARNYKPASQTSAETRKSQEVTKPNESPKPQGAETATPAASAPSEKDVVIQDILALRSKHGILQGMFITYVKKATGKTEVNAEKWSLDEAVKVRDTIKQIKEASV